ncbi:hypothetical protein QYE76_069357 [Lolium multiflorum]|uniref:Transposase (putative) gypsy type domain-containing protein n=1 Tax=Lolium multiflorum TaxID=4521 RepID=A0AAD8SI27_LOLMU|nr:hypothetical protein QYE76_069357 [Lolium multiflorum]
MDIGRNLLCSLHRHLEFARDLELVLGRNNGATGPDGPHATITVYGPPGLPDLGLSMMSSMTPPPADEPIMATPISSAPPPFIPVQLDPTKDSGKDIEGTSAVPEKHLRRRRRRKKWLPKNPKLANGTRNPKVNGGLAPPLILNCKIWREKGLQPGSWRATPGALSPAPQDNEMVLTKALVERGFSFPPSDFFLEILKAYGLQPHNISPNSVLAISNHVTLCEGHLRVTPELSLFQYYFTVKKERIRQSSELATCGTITFMIRPGRVYPHTDRHESARYWSAGFFYLKDLTRAVRRICKLTEEGLTGKDLTLSWFTKRIQPLQHRDRLMFQYTGRDDPMRVTKDNLSADALDKRIRVLIKVPRELHVHVCNKDIHMNGSGTALEALEENELGTLLRVPSTGNTDPEAASEAEAPEASRPARGRRPLLPAPMRNAPAKKPAPKAPRAPKKKGQAISASIPVTPEVEVPWLHRLKQDPKDVINIDDLPEDSAHHGDSAKGTSSPVPPSAQPSSAFAGPTEEEKEQKAKLLQTTRNCTKMLRVHVLEQITEIEEAAGTRKIANEAIPAAESRLQEETAKHSKFDELSAKVQENQARKELSEKHARDLAELNEKLEKSQGRVISVISKNKVLEAEAEAIDKLIFPSLGFEWSKESNLKRTEAYDEARISIDALFEACRGIAKTLSLKKAKTTVIDTMTKLMQQVPDFIKDWQKSSARGAASLVLATCKAHFPSLNLADVARGAPEDSDMGALLAETEGYEQLFVRRVDHSFWYNQHDLPSGFSDAEEEAGEPEYYGEGSGSSGEHSGGDSGDDSDLVTVTAAPPTSNLKKRTPSRVPVLNNETNCIILAPEWVCNNLNS